METTEKDSILNALSLLAADIAAKDNEIYRLKIERNNANAAREEALRKLTESNNHLGFIIVCRKCGSTNCEVEPTMDNCRVEITCCKCEYSEEK